MEGFFSKKETQSIHRPDGKTLSCVSCGRAMNCKSPKLKEFGDFGKRILNILPSPSYKTDKTGGLKDVSYLKSIYNQLGIDLENDCLTTFALKCFSEEKENQHQINSCRRFLLKLIDVHKPYLIVLFGDVPLQSIVGNRWKKGIDNILKWRGWQIPDQDFQAWICPTFDPATLTDEKKIGKVLFKQDLKKAFSCLDKEFPILKQPKIKYLKPDDYYLIDKIKASYTAFDYETTGLKPQADGHKIACASIAVNKDLVYVFRVDNNEPFIRYLKDKNRLKIAQNMKYEDTWSKEVLNIKVEGWFFDTMLAAHIIDNRPGVTGLKFQTYVQFGVIDYDSEINPYLKSGGTNEKNTVLTLLDTPKEKKLMEYCALDSIFEYRLAMKWYPTILGTQGLSKLSPVNSNFPNAYRLLHDGVLSLAKAERQGMRVDRAYIKRQNIKLDKKIEVIEKKIFNSKFYRHWSHINKGKINLNSGTQLAHYLYNVKKLKPAKLTDKGKGSTDEEALRALNIPELDMILERSKLSNLKGTFLHSIYTEQVRGKMHPFFNLHLVRTYRSSSDSPNFQNFPKRDKDSMKTIRKALYPRRGHQLLELDFSGLEVAIAACYHKDPIMIKYLIDPTTDMHGDTTKQIFKIKDWDRKRKDHSYLRSATKNSFIFPQFYGSYWANCAKDFCSNWLHLPSSGRFKHGTGFELTEGVFAADLLIKVGLNTFDKFAKHLKIIEDDFWNNRFKVYTKWKDTHYANYLKNGYVSLKTGFVCQGIMSRNDAINYPIQGAAFHCLLWSFIQIDKELEEKGMKTKLIGQIHDAVVLDVFPEELKDVYNIVQKICTIDLPIAFDWINVPLKIDAELCPVDGSWADKEEWKPE